MKYQASHGKLQVHTYLCWIIKHTHKDYHSEFPTMKLTDDADSFIKMYKIIFAAYRLLRKIMSDPGTLFVSEKFWQICQSLNMHQILSSSYNHQTNGQAEACIKFAKYIMKKWLDTNNNIYLALLEILSTPISPGLLSWAALLFGRPIRGLEPKLSRFLILFEHNDAHYFTFTQRQRNANKEKDTCRSYLFSPQHQL